MFCFVLFFCAYCITSLRFFVLYNIEKWYQDTKMHAIKLEKVKTNNQKKPKQTKQNKTKKEQEQNKNKQKTK